MAGAVKPSYTVKKEAKYQLLGGLSELGSPSGLFDGTVPHAWDNKTIMYFNTYSAYVDIELFEKAIIHRFYSWNNNNNQRLKILMYDGTDYNIDKTSSHLNIRKQTPFTWAPFTETLGKGKYRFIIDPSDTLGGYRCDGEWYIEKATTPKILLESGHQIYNYDSSWSLINEMLPVSETNVYFDTYGEEELSPSTLKELALLNKGRSKILLKEI